MNKHQKLEYCTRPTRSYNSCISVPGDGNGGNPADGNGGNPEEGPADRGKGDGSRLDKSGGPLPAEVGTSNTGGVGGGIDCTDRSDLKTTADRDLAAAVAVRNWAAAFRLVSVCRFKMANTSARALVGRNKLIIWCIFTSTCSMLETSSLVSFESTSLNERTHATNNDNNRRFNRLNALCGVSSLEYNTGRPCAINDGAVS